MKLAYLLTRSGSGTSGGPTAGRVHGANGCCSRSIDIVHVVADQEHSNRTRTVPRYQYRTELVWKLVRSAYHALDSTFKNGENESKYLTSVYDD